MSNPKLTDYLTRVPITVDNDQTVAFARSLMVEHGVRHLPVVEAGGKVVGVVSQRDIFVADATLGDDADDLPIERVMQSKPFVVEVDADLASTARTMAAQRIGSAVLLDGGKVAGLFTTIDALNALADSLAG